MEASDAWRHLRLENEGILMGLPFYFISVLFKSNKASGWLGNSYTGTSDPSSSSSLPTFMYVNIPGAMPNSGCQI